MQLLCPECGSEEVGPHPDPRSAQLRCANCGEAFDRAQAHVTLAEVETRMPDPVPERLFELDAGRARAELSDPDGAIEVIDGFSDADELHYLIDAAQAKGIVRGPGGLVAIAVYPASLVAPDPVLGVFPGRGPTLLGPELKLEQGAEEDPLDFTIRILERMVEEADGLASGRAADSRRLDRIAAFMNRRRDGGDVYEFVATEIVASGRRLLDADE
jgi:hypothetical protein